MRLPAIALAKTKSLYVSDRIISFVILNVEEKSTGVDGDISLLDKDNSS